MLIVTSNHSIDDEKQRAGRSFAKEVHIKKGAWIVAGVTIGEGSVVAAGSVVIKDIEPNCLYAGNPVKKIRCL